MAGGVTARKIVVPALAIIGAGVVGAFLGFSSCGGYIWHTQVGYVLVFACALIAAASPPRGAANVLTRAGLSLATLAAFLLGRAAGFSAYLGVSPGGDHLRQIGAILGSGLC